MVVHTTMYLEYHTVVVLCYFFWFWWEIVFGVTYVLSVQYSCAVVSFFFEAVKLLSVQCTVVLLCQFFGCSGK